MHTNTVLKHTLLGAISAILLFSATTHATFNGVTVLQTLMSGSIITTGSTTEVLYKGIRKNTLEYKLLQQAIDTHILDNKQQFIPLKREFTKDSVRKFASLYFGVKLPLYGSSLIDPDTQKSIIIQLQTSVTNKKETYVNTIKNNILDTVNHTTINGKIATGNQTTDQLLQQLNDPYSLHLTGDENRVFQQFLDGGISGIGVSISKKTESYITILEVLADSPAIKAGLLDNDRIIAIDDNNITTEDKLSDLIVKIQGPVKSSVKLTIQRGESIFTKIIIRDKILFNPIKVKEINTDTVLMSISIFQLDVYKLFLKELSTLQQYKTIIIDLRDNGGGSLDDTRSILNHIVPQGDAIYYMVSDNKQTPILSQGIDKSFSLENKKIIFLTNKYTASASEIFAGITREYDVNSLIIGEQTFGKGSVQTVRTYADGSTLKLTTAHRLLGKSKKSIQGIGLTPDYVIIDNPLTTQDEVMDYVLSKI